jgi:hypothetical protein
MACVYEYHVFISYHRTSDTVSPWVRNHFYPRLCELLDSSVDYPVNVFYDEAAPAGMPWPRQQRHALLQTRVLVPVCSPKYFLDEWCIAEWQSMARREELVMQTEPDRSHGLIYPVIYSDSRNFPSWATTRRMRSLQRWNCPYPHFQQAPAYIDFYDEVEKLAEELVQLIEHAPEWRADWPVETPTPGPPALSGFPGL